MFDYIFLKDNDSVGVQSINDGKLEVVAIFSSFHIAQLQMGLSQPYRLGQANNVKVKFFLNFNILFIILLF